MGPASQRARILTDPTYHVQRCPFRVWSQKDRSAHLSLVHTPTSFDRDAEVQHSCTSHQSMVEVFVPTSSRFPLGKSEEKCTPAETRTPKFRLGGREFLLYLLNERPLERRAQTELQLILEILEILELILELILP